MARITPKTNWIGADIPVASDFNRIEGNTQQASHELDDFFLEPKTISTNLTFQDGIETNTIEPATGDTVTISGVGFKDGGIIGLIWGE